MSVNILTYMLAASLIQGGMNWKQAVFTVFLGTASCWRRCC
jgi:NCS1 family nucleobase:cation symporter-1